jgi:DNA-binding Xre family transcriptional regulator
MKFADAFRLTMFHFKLSGADIAEKSGMSSAQISNFRNGKNIRTETLERILDALPPEARLYMLDLVAHGANDVIPSPVKNYEAGQNATSDG